MRFLIVPNVANSYDQRMVNDLAAGFVDIGHEAIPLGGPVPADVIGKIAEVTSADVVMQVNRFRPSDLPLPPNVRHIAWFQDVFPDTQEGMGAAEREGDIVYALGDAGVLGLKTEFPCFVGSLVTGVTPAMTNFKRAAADAAEGPDFSLCGSILPPLVLRGDPVRDLAWRINNIFDRMPLVGDAWIFRRLRRRYLGGHYVPYALAVSLREMTAALYRPLRGELDILKLADILRSQAEPYAISRKRQPLERQRSRRRVLARLMEAYRFSPGADGTAVENFINYLAREYPRVLDRAALARATLKLSRSLELYGTSWDKYSEFQAYYRGMVEDPYVLLSIFQRSRINLANNTHGLGLHSRTLECMAVGGFIFTHASPHDDKPGGMLTSFDPDIHYGVYTPETFHEKAERWLEDEPGRRRAGELAAIVVREKHMWSHRAQQIVDDLKR